MRVCASLILSFIIFNAKAQSPVNTAKLADSLLSTGNHTVCLITYQFPSNIERLQKKALDSLHRFKTQNLLAKQLDVKLLEDGTSYGLHFKPEFGLSTQEFDTLFTGFQVKRKAVYGDTLSIYIANVKGVISFNATGKLVVYNGLSINTGKAQIVYNAYLLTRENAVQKPFYAPTLVGYEVDWPVPVDKKKTNPSTGIMGLTIGRDNDNGRSTIALLFKNLLAHTGPVAIELLN
jgi:hypothetical protein